MTAAFQQRIDEKPEPPELLWPRFAAAIIEDGNNWGLSWPWFDGSNVYVSDRALLLRFRVTEEPFQGVVKPYRGNLWRTPNAVLIEWTPPSIQIANLISSEPCRKTFPIDREQLEDVGETRLLNQWFANRYLKLLAELPGLTIEVRKSAMQLQFDGGRGVLAAMSRE